MALGTDVYLANEVNAQPVANVTLAAPWQNVIDAGGVTQDAATVTNPTSQCTKSTSHIFKRRKGQGSFIRARLGYDDGLTGITNPKVKLFGRANSTDAWQLLPNIAGNFQVTMTTAATDAEDGTLKYTTPDPEDHMWDCDGNDEFIFAVETALAGTGVTNNAILQARII